MPKAVIPAGRSVACSRWHFTLVAVVAAWCLSLLHATGGEP